MDKQTTNQVRQVLMNELGLTREVMREEMSHIIRNEAAKIVERAVRAAKDFLLTAVVAFVFLLATSFLDRV